MVASPPVRAVRKLLAPFRQPRRSQTLTVLAGLAALSAFLLWQSAGIDHYRQNLALNVGADIIGAIVTIFVITPLISRAQEGRVREHPRLDYEWYTDQVHGATSCVKLLDTFSNLLDQPVTDRFFRAVTLAISRQAHIQILLLNPDSLAVLLRAQEVGDGPGSADFRREILRNLRTLHLFEQRLTEAQRRRFEVRLYSASAGVTMYRWDDKALVSFLSVGRLSGQGAQLEVTVSSPLGMFVEQRFEELWQQGAPMHEFMRLPVTLVEADGARRDFVTSFVVADGAQYIVDHGVVSHMARRRDGHLSAYCRADPDTRYELIVVDDNEDLCAQLSERFADKYDLPRATYVWLRPLG
ncbi:hypothetical protein HC028_13400 [Planosporangium flavigriseum]|uniref:Uncharacterized protein n=1 Tax=Planosporangium flavigriseum TaxID=373681 RepID=A0A8J3PPX9_9ACTN|nr:hypothetical protein [Planosporangium flavigriseum]NJC65493.1 hypothetical protein [Planosporangium flavigriseum]GIG76383.1 hypothetical protein Pfl04_47870 [Planosporangium flavigriseum]